MIKKKSPRSNKQRIHRPHVSMRVSGIGTLMQLVKARERVTPTYSVTTVLEKGTSRQLARKEKVQELMSKVKAKASGVSQHGINGIHGRKEMLTNGKRGIQISGRKEIHPVIKARGKVHQLFSATIVMVSDTFLQLAPVQFGNVGSDPAIDFGCSIEQVTNDDDFVRPKKFMRLRAHPYKSNPGPAMGSLKIKDMTGRFFPIQEEGSVEVITKDSDVRESWAQPMDKWERLSVKLDSGSIDNVAPKGIGTNVKLRSTTASRGNEKYRAANGTTIDIFGEKELKGWNECGDRVNMTMQIADVKVPLGSVYRIVKWGQCGSVRRG